MIKKTLPLVLLWVLLFSLFSQSVSAQIPVPIPNQEHFIMETLDEPASVDPAWAIDTASRALIFNVYDTLVFFDQEGTYEFVPHLATDWWINQPPHPFAPAGTNNTWYFRIRGTSGTHTMENYGCWPAPNPTCSYWHETSPWYSKIWHLWKWEDNGDGVLSASDIIKMIRACQNWDGTTPMAVDVLQTFLVDDVVLVRPPDKYADRSNGVWNQGESAVRDNNDNGVYDVGDTVLCGAAPPIDTILRYPGDYERYADNNDNGDWDVGEPAVRDNNDNGVFDGEYPDGPDTVLCGAAPPIGTILNDPDDYEKYADRYSNGDWDVREEAVRDNNDNGVYDVGDTVLCGAAPPTGSILDCPDDYERYADNNDNGIWDVGEPAVRDNNDNGVYDAGDIILCGAPPPLSMILRDPDPGQKTITVTELPVYFHDGSDLTTEDVEYSFERLMVMDRSGGPAWKIYEPLLGVYQANMGWPEDLSCPINLAVQCNSTHVWFNLVMPYPPLMQILCGSWASIVNEEFCVAHGCWPSHDWAHWKAYHDPEISPLDAAGYVMCGTGPYMLDYWTHGVEWSIVRFVDHWQQWPAPHCSRYLDRVTNKIVYEWATRYADFIGCHADEVYIPMPYLPWMILNWPTKWHPGMPTNPEEYAEDIRCLPGLPTLYLEAMFFTLDIHPDSPFVGTGSFPHGIPPYFFRDYRIRKAFAYSFNYTEFIEEVYWGDEAVQPTSCIPVGKLYHNPDNPTYSYDPAMAASLFQEVSSDPNNPLYGFWEQGFTMTIVYSIAGRVETQTAAMLLRDGVQDVFETYGGGPVEMDVLGLGLGAFEHYLVGYPLFKSHMPLFITGWLDEYMDPHDDVHAFMHSYGRFSRFQGYNNPLVNALIEEGIRTPYGDEREAIYYELQQIYYDDAPSVGLFQPLKRHWEKDWVQGWYYNPLYPGQKYFKHLWKGLTGDIDGNNEVGITDAGKVSAHWCIPGIIEGPLGYNKIADVGPVLQYPTPGVISIVDAGVVSAHYREYVP